mgnify:CR=1 FL=1
MWDLIARDERVDRVPPDGEQAGNLRHVEHVAGVGDLFERRTKHFGDVSGHGNSGYSMLASPNCGLPALSSSWLHVPRGDR